MSGERMPSEMTLDELQEWLPEGYAISDLTREQQVTVDLALMLYEEIRETECLHEGLLDNPTIIDKMRLEIGEEVIDEIRRNFISTLKDMVVSMIEEEIV